MTMQHSLCIFPNNIGAHAWEISTQFYLFIYHIYLIIYFVFLWDDYVNIHKIIRNIKYKTI